MGSGRGVEVVGVAFTLVDVAVDEVDVFCWVFDETESFFAIVSFVCINFCSVIGITPIFYVNEGTSLGGVETGFGGKT